MYHNQILMICTETMETIILSGIGHKPSWLISCLRETLKHHVFNCPIDASECKYLVSLKLLILEDGKRET